MIKVIEGENSGATSSAAEPDLSAINATTLAQPGAYILIKGDAWGDATVGKYSFNQKGDAYVDVESLAHQYRICGRGQRYFSVQQMFCAKSSAYRAAIRRLDILCHSNHTVYTSLPCQSWEVPSDHYVFGMRRILI